MAFTVAQLEGLYLAYFGRPADADGLAFYLAHPEMDIWAIAKAFSASPESQALYGATFNSGVIDSIYQNLFNRSAESAGLQYWSGEVSAGRLSAAGAAYGILLGAQNSDLTTVNNKLVVCAAFTNAMDTPHEKSGYAGNEAAAMARSFIHHIDASDAAKAAGLATAETAVAQIAATTSVSTANEVIASTAIASGTTWSVTTDHPNFLAADGIVDSGYAYVTGLSSGASIQEAGAAAQSILITALANDTSADFLNLEMNPTIADDNNAYSLIQGSHFLSFNLPGIEHLSLDVTANIVVAGSKVAGWQPDYSLMYANIAAPQLQSLLVTGDQALTLYLHGDTATVIDASQLTVTSGGAYSAVTGRLDYGFIYDADSSTPALVVRGSQAFANEIFGSDWDNVIIGGSQDDMLWGGGGADTLTGGGGNDMFRFNWAVDSDYANSAAAVDTITDFSANTVAEDVGGLPGPHGAVYERTLRNGDVIDLTGYNKTTISFGIAGSADGAATIVKQLQNTWHNDINAALDQTTGMLYLDTNGDGAVDTRIELTGVTTMTSAAFLISHG